MYIKIDANSIVTGIYHNAIPDEPYIDVPDQPISEVSKNGVYQYKYVDGEIIDRTQAEIDADTPDIPSLISAQNQIDANAAAIAELAEIIAGGDS